MMHQSVSFEPFKVKVDGIREIRREGTDHEMVIQYWGIATLQPNGKYHCYANVGNTLCIVEVTITFNEALEPNVKQDFFPWCSGETLR